MGLLLRALILVGLLSIELYSVYAVLHPHVSADYRAYFIDRSSTDYEPEHYPSTPEEGMVFSHPGLPDWVATTRGLSFRDEGGGRWTDANLRATPGLLFTREFSGDVCVELKAYTIPWLGGQDMTVRFGHEDEAVKLVAGGPTTYDIQFHNVHAADRMDFLLPSNLPPLVERVHSSGDIRRLGVSFHTLRIVPGQCS